MGAIAICNSGDRLEEVAQIASDLILNGNQKQVVTESKITLTKHITLRGLGMMELLTLEEFAEVSGLSWVLEEPETYYRYKYDKMTYEECNNQTSRKVSESKDY